MCSVKKPLNSEWKKWEEKVSPTNREVISNQSNDSMVLQNWEQQVKICVYMKQHVDKQYANGIRNNGQLGIKKAEISHLD